MPQSSTVENYLKAIYQAEIPQNNRGELVSMGQLSSALGVVPGTATTMVKALAETGLVRYEPYAGVQLTEAGQRLAALVLRRHRVLELFLVKVLDMSWAEVHEEAERLEHAASDRLIDRIDAMLGRPSVDPHGDPIPDSDGSIVTPRYQSLLTCPLNTSLVLSRVSNQDTDFLRFLESNELTPGQSIRVENRDNAADHVLVRRVGSQEAVAIGMRAAATLLVANG
ncbi:MAG TPA: metal-dependent transcriptional regulator [Acidobacteria bacterium]|nr:metal-dependent transcriptional regulator [Acidobacteriota bacterium]